MKYMEAVQNYLKYLKSLDRSKATIEGYLKELKYFNEFLITEYNCTIYIEEITLNDIHNYLEYIKIKGRESAGRARVVNIIRGFYKYLYKNNIVDENLGDKLESIKVKNKERTFITEEEFKELKDAIDNKNVQAVVETIFFTGLRISEVTNLTLDDVNLEERIINVINGKGNKDRKVPINDKLYNVLQKYLKYIRPNSNSNKFFCTKKTGEISPQYINRELKKACKKLGWEKDISAHILRHSFASNLISKNVSLPAVRDLLGHADLRTTSRYIHQDIKQLFDAVNSI